MTSKQETCCLLAGLDLFSCFETIEPVSVSGTTKIGTNEASAKSVLRKYADRSENLFGMSLTEFFYHLKNPRFNANHLVNNYWKKGPIHQGRRKYIIPHFTGCSSDNTYPPTENYAKSIFIRHVPWHRKFDCLTKQTGATYLEMFNNLINSNNCPLTVKLNHARSKQRYLNMYKNKEATGKERIIDYSQFSIEASDETKTLVELLNTVSARFNDTDEYDKLFDYGKTFDWSVIKRTGKSQQRWDSH